MGQCERARKYTTEPAFVTTHIKQIFLPGDLEIQSVTCHVPPHPFLCALFYVAVQPGTQSTTSQKNTGELSEQESTDQQLV